MTIQEMHDWFNFMVDKYDSPYYTPDEIDQVINRAQLDYVHELALSLDENGTGEKSHDFNVLLAPIITPISSILASNGTISLSSIKAELLTGKLVKILSVTNGDGNDVKFTRHNDSSKHNRNYFKKPTNTTQKYTVSSTGINIKPTTNAGFDISAIREPIDVNLTGLIDCELEIVHNKIVARAIAMAGIATEQQASTALNDMTKI